MRIFNPDSGEGGRPAPDDIWRTWLITGARAHPIDRRRLQGEHRGLKQILAEGGDADIITRPWRDFSRAMVRQSVNEAMGRLTSRERVVVTMAYFAGFSNQEIAKELGMTDRGVQRSLRRALDRLSSALERGRRIALGLVAAVTAGRIAQWMRDSLSISDAQIVAAVVVAGIVVVAPTAAPAHAAGRPSTTQAAQSVPAAGVPNPSSAQPAAPQTATSATAAAPSVSAPALPAVTVPSISIPSLPAVKVPKLPSTDALKKTL